MPAASPHPLASRILELKWANPFKPFVVKTIDGKRFRINDVMNITVLPLATRNKVHFAAAGGFHSVPIADVASVDLAMLPRRSKRRSLGKRSVDGRCVS